MSVALVAATSILGTVGADAATRAAAAAPAQEGFSNGQAKAVAQVQRFAPGVGSLQLGVTSGRSVAEVTNSLAQAQAQTLDLGLIGSSLTAESCNQASPIKESDLPQPTTVDNRSGDASVAADDYGVAGDALGGGREEVAATTVPSATAKVSGTASNFGPVASISNGHSEADTRVVDGKAREALATASADLDIAGLIQLRNLQWRAFHRTGADPAAEGGFAIGSATVGSVPLPVDDLTPLEDALNTALAASGLTIELPRVERLTDPTDLIRVSPLRITLKDSPAGKATLGPALNLTREQRAQLFDAVVGVYCRAASVLLVGDVSLSVVSGTGFMIIEVGGVEAMSAESVIGNPFGEFAPVQAQAGESTVEEGGFTFANGVPATPPSATTTATAGSDLGPLASICESLHATRKPLCSRGLGAPLGVAGVAATAAMAYLDWRKQRRLLTEARTGDPA